METDHIAAIILAAGQSKRMGAFKPLLPFGPQTVIESCIKTFLDADVRTVIVVVGQSVDSRKLADCVTKAGATVAVNKEEVSEMNASIAAGVSALPEPARAVLITPADHPAVPAEVVQQLIAEWREGWRLVKPAWNGRGGHPVLVDLAFRNELLDLNPETGLKALFQANENQVKRVPAQSKYIACDMDTWDDYRALHREVFGVEPPPLRA